MSPLRSNSAFQWLEDIQDGRESTEINEIKEELEAEEKEEIKEDFHDGYRRLGFHPKMMKKMVVGRRTMIY
ncbi:hypothetical protein LXL04_002616 [Taraxacum kok-saghyz]